jgi:hypothetical protein
MLGNEKKGLLGLIFYIQKLLEERTANHRKCLITISTFMASVAKKKSNINTTQQKVGRRFQVL